MVWNTINDPLFAYVQDNYHFSIVKTRRHSILYGAPLFAVSFLVVWFPWADYSEGGGWLAGVQLTVALCFYDSMFTFVLLAYCALFAEMSSCTKTGSDWSATDSSRPSSAALPSTSQAPSPTTTELNITGVAIWLPF